MKKNSNNLRESTFPETGPSIDELLCSHKWLRKQIGMNLYEEECHYCGTAYTCWEEAQPGDGEIVWVQMKKKILRT